MITRQFSKSRNRRLSAFSPNDLGGLVLWLDPSRHTAADGDAVAAMTNWADATTEQAAFSSTTVGTLRNNYGGYVGFKFVVGGSDIIVTALGRWRVAGNSQTHPVQIRNSAGTVIASATTPSTGTDGTYVYVSITPITLTAGSTYYCQTQSANGGDQWYNNDTAVTPTPGITAVQCCFNDNPTGIPGGIGGANNPYNPPGFVYNIVPSIYSTGTKQPLYKIDIQAGKPALLFDSGDDQIFTGGMTIGTVVAAAHYTAATFDSYDALFTGYANQVLIINGDSGRGDLYSAASGVTQWINGAANVYHVTPATNAWKIFSATDTRLTNTTYSIGQDRQFTNRGWKGYIGDVICYSRVLNDQERKKVERYLGKKYAIAVV